MFCTNCGKEIKAGSNFCENCGAAVNDQSITTLASASGQADGVMGNVQNQQGNPIVSLVALIVLAGIVVFLANALGFISFGNEKDIEAAEKQVISFVTENYGEIPTVYGEVLEKIDYHVLVVVKFEVEVSGTQFNGSYLLDISNKNHIAWKWTDELPVDYDFEANLDEILAVWGI